MFGVRIGVTDCGPNTWRNPNGGSAMNGTKTSHLGKMLVVGGVALWLVGKYGMKG